eukprot:TRINITY_DN22319_c0_g1_i1.p2 TRINITY_DN22319_c0_g1~~TRINITY_DN22319_c0_g1_i1.p2  ORF type:complete len:114 (-),score=5.03 TRINITY_DN22319_c0_g1_i1:67-408(-)
MRMHPVFAVRKQKYCTVCSRSPRDKDWKTGAELLSQPPTLPGQFVQLFLVRALALFGPRSGQPAVELEEKPEVAICIRSLFAPGIGENGFVHQKGGFYDRRLLRTCAAEHVRF